MKPCLSHLEVSSYLPAFSAETNKTKREKQRQHKDSQRWMAKRTRNSCPILVYLTQNNVCCMPRVQDLHTQASHPPRKYSFESNANSLHPFLQSLAVHLVGSTATVLLMLHAESLFRDSLARVLHYSRWTMCYRQILNRSGTNRKDAYCSLRSIHSQPSHNKQTLHITPN